ncbi:MAG: hypothetical protein IJV13_04045 [Prevotella sp.]|nr:hypothetical protein [Prevotella sp.]
MKKKLLKLALCAAALLPMGAWAATIEEEVFSVNYAELATTNVEFGTNANITRGDDVISTTRISDTNYNLYQFTCSNFLTANDVLCNRTGMILRFKNTSTIGVAHNGGNATVFGVQNVNAGDRVLVAYVGDALTQDAVVNATLGATTSTFTHNYTYNGSRSFDYTVYTLTAAADGVVGFQLPAGFLLGKVSVVRDIEEPSVSTTTTWSFNDLTSGFVYEDISIINDANKSLYARAKKPYRNITMTVTALDEEKTFTFADGYTVKVSNTLNINSKVRNPNAVLEDATASTATSSDDGIGFLAFNASVGGTLYVIFKSSASANNAFRAYHKEYGVSDSKIKSKNYNATGEIQSIAITATTTAGTFFFGDVSNACDIYAVRFVPTTEKKDEWIYIGSTGYATWGNNSGKDIIELPTGLTAYAAKAGTNSVTLTSLDKMRRGQAYVVKGTPETNYGLTYDGTESVGGEYNGGDMQRVSADMKNFAPTNGETGDALRNRYILASDDGVAKFFVPSGSGTLKKGKAYLQTSKTLTPTAGSKGIEMIFEDETTGIQNVAPASAVNGKYYNLMGVEVAHPTKGVYIVNGKKVVVK